MLVLAFNNTDGDAKVERKNHQKYFLWRVNITNYNVLIDGRNFYDQPINDLVKQYGEFRKTATWQGDDYTTGCLWGYPFFKDHYNLTAFYLSKKKIRCWFESNSVNWVLWDAKN